MKSKLAILILAAMLIGCTDNQRARSAGGAMTVTLPPGQKLVNATWKNEQLWYLTRPAFVTESPETLTFKEKSSFGLMEGSVLFKETK